MRMTCITPVGRGRVLGNHLLLLSWERIGQNSGLGLSFDDISNNIMMREIPCVMIISTNKTRIFGFTLGFILNSGFRVFVFFLAYWKISWIFLYSSSFLQKVGMIWIVPH
jgi:hypothetical protein